jgi:hypothetical protein
LGIWTLGFLQDVSRKDRAFLILISSLGILLCFAGLVFVRFLWKWLYKRTSQKVLSTWQKSLKSGEAPQIDVAHYLSEGSLRILSMQLFGLIGYQILNRNDEKDEGYVRMVNLDGGLELVACRQQQVPIEIQPIYELHVELKRAGAAQGYFWASGGFTPEAIHWAKQKSIILVDRPGIGHLMDCVRIHRSRFLK